MVLFDISTVGSVSGLVWQFYNGQTTAWETFVPLYRELPGNEDQAAYTFSGDGGEILPAELMLSWGPLAFTNTAPHTGTAIDTEARYWIRVYSTAVTTAPTVLRVQKRDYNSYCSPEDVYNFLQLKFTEGAFTFNTRPSLATVEDIIHRKQGYIDRRSRKSWRPNISIDYFPYDLTGLILPKYGSYDILSLEMWNGSTWESKTSGRGEDYFFIPKIGKISFSRLFLLPARFVGYRGYGSDEFDFGIRVKYLYGRNRFIADAEGAMAAEACIKLTAIDLLMTGDYSRLLVSGTDRMQVNQRITEWKAEIEEILDQLRPVEIF